MLRRTVLTGAGSAALLGLAAHAPARADTLDEVKKRGTLVVGTEAAYVPVRVLQGRQDHRLRSGHHRPLRPQAGREGATGRHRLERHHPGALRQEVRRHRLGDDHHQGTGGEGAVLHALRRCQQRHPAARRRGQDQDRGRSVRQDCRRADRQRRRRHHQDVRGEAEGRRQARLRRREAVRALPRGVSGPAQQAHRRGGELQVHHAGGDEGRARQVQDDRRRLRHHRLFRHGVPQGGRSVPGLRQRAACRDEEGRRRWRSCRRNGSARRWIRRTRCPKCCPDASPTCPTSTGPSCGTRRPTWCRAPSSRWRSRSAR